MPIINTLLTAQDKMGGVLESAKKKVKDSTDGMKKSLDGVNDSVRSVEDSFDDLSNIDLTSFSGIVDTFKNIRDRAAEAELGASRWATSLAMTGAVIGATAFGIMTLVNSSAQYVSQLNEIHTATGVSIEDLQRLQSVFSTTGLAVEKFGDLNKDTLDHLGDAFRDGSGPAKDMEAYGLKLQDYNKYLNQANGGVQALIHTYYELKSAGRTQAEIVNMMETLASDSSHLISVLSELGTEQDALNALQKVNVQLSDDSAKAYQEYEKKVKSLDTTFQLWKANALAPTVTELTTILDLLNGNWDSTNFSRWAKNFYYGGDTAIAKMLRDLDNVPASSIPGTEANNRLNAYAANALADQKALTNPEPTGGWVDQDKLKKEQEAAKKKADAEAKRAAADAKRAQKEQEQEAKRLQQQKDNAKKWAQQQELNIMTESQKVDAQYASDLEKLKEYHDKKLLSEDEYQRSLDVLQAGYSVKRAEADAEINERMTKAMFDKQSESYEKQNEFLSKGIDIAGQFATAIASSAEKGSAAWYVATTAQKAFAVAQAIMAANLAAVQAAAMTPGDVATRFAAGESMRAWGYANAAIIAATGIMEIAGARANGGDVAAGGTYLVGERGPELFTAPGTGGQITSNANLQKAIGDNGGKTISPTIKFEQHNVFQSSGVTADDLNKLQQTTETMIDRKLRTESRPGGILNP
ncbi:putative tape measure protein [Serratia phage vB_SmaS_Opt-169]|nr:putative tape measure protein [Serratia phage vB_SmaS_Opt-169]